MCDDAAKPSSEEQNQPTSCKVVTAESLFEGEREIVIEHGGEKYRLRITRRNRLILQK